MLLALVAALTGCAALSREATCPAGYRWVYVDLDNVTQTECWREVTDPEWAPLSEYWVEQRKSAPRKEKR